VVFTVSVTVSLALTVKTIYSHVTTPPPVVEVVNEFSPSPLSLTPDIVLIILDGYGRADVLDSVYGFDNGPVITNLSDHGFTIPDSANANYAWTHFSVASMLEMSYLIDETAEISNSDLAILKATISGDNRVVDVLKDHGYAYVHGDTDHWLNTCGPQVDHCEPGPFVDLTANSLLAGTPIGGLLYPVSGDPTTALNLTRIDELRNWPEFRSTFDSRPTFFFFHLVLPHPPLYLDAECRPRVETLFDGRYMNLGQYSAEELARRKDAYIQQIACANSVIGEFVDEVDPDTTVVITSDHGPDSFEPMRASQEPTPVQEAERLGTFTAIRLPDGCEGPGQDHQLINTFRVVFGCLSDQPVEMLDKAYFVAGYGGDVAKLKDPDLAAEALTTYTKEQGP
jgi:hypothetical protein